MGLRLGLALRLRLRTLTLTLTLTRTLISACAEPAKKKTLASGASGGEFSPTAGTRSSAATSSKPGPAPAKSRKVAVPVVGPTEGASPATAARPAVSGAVPVDDEPSDERAAMAPVSMLTPTLPASPPPTS